MNPVTQSSRWATCRPSGTHEGRPDRVADRACSSSPSPTPSSAGSGSRVRGSAAAVRPPGARTAPGRRRARVCKASRTPADPETALGTPPLRGRARSASGVASDESARCPRT
jgi:hypothetical protein